jgi:hypothetical protein
VLGLFKSFKPAYDAASQQLILRFKTSQPTEFPRGVEKDVIVTTDTVLEWRIVLAGEAGWGCWVCVGCVG